MYRNLEDMNRSFNCLCSALKKTGSRCLAENDIPNHHHGCYETECPGEFIQIKRQAYTHYFNEKYGKLDSVVFETTSAGADYKVFFIPLESSGAPSSNESKWTQLASGTVEYSGYMSVSTNNYVLPYGSGAIGVRIDGTQNNIGSRLGCDEWLTNSYGQLLFNPPVKKNTSYMKYGSTIYELSNFYSQYLGDETGSNFVIKAVTTSDKGIKKYDVNNDGKISVADAVLIQRYVLGEILDDYPIDEKISLPSAEEPKYIPEKNEAPFQPTVRTVKFTDNKGWGTTYIYAWNSETGETNAKWPGVPMSYQSTNSYKQTVYKADVNTKYDMIIFTTSVGTPQTQDIVWDYTVNGYWVTDQKTTNSTGIEVWVADTW